MSEPLSAVEIEDVLSSIRRLVSEDLRPTHKLVSAALQNGAAKLILTPALRVVSNDMPGYDHKPDTLDDPGDLQSVLAGIEASEPEADVEQLPMFGSVRLQEMAHLRDDAAENDGAFASDANFLASAMSRINGLSSPGPHPQLETIEDVVAAVGAAVGPDEWELDGGEPAPQAKAFADTVWNNAEGQMAQSDAQAPLILMDKVESNGQDDDRPDHGHMQVEDGFQSVVEDALEPTFVAVDEANDIGAPMGHDSIVFQEDVAAPRMLDAADQGDTENTGNPSSFAPGSTTQGDADDLEDSAGFLNEDMLRDIVRSMVQAELQGTLGERITLSVRKLVRSEINRALAARD